MSWKQNYNKPYRNSAGIIQFTCTVSSLSCPQQLAIPHRLQWISYVRLFVSSNWPRLSPGASDRVGWWSKRVDDGTILHLNLHFYLFSVHAIQLNLWWCLQKSRWVWSYSGYEQLQQGDRKRWSCSTFLNVLVVLFESVTGIAGDVDWRERINSTDDVFVALLAFCILYWINTSLTENPYKYSYDISKVSWRCWSCTSWGYCMKYPAEMVRLSKNLPRCNDKPCYPCY